MSPKCDLQPDLGNPNQWFWQWFEWFVGEFAWDGTSIGDDDG